MQCMMKEVCAQCLQKHVDPVTGREEFIFSCFNQDQEMDRVDFPNLNARLRQNTVQEKLSNPGSTTCSNRWNCRTSEVADSPGSIDSLDISGSTAQPDEPLIDGMQLKAR